MAVGQLLRLRPGAALAEDGPALVQGMARVSLANTGDAALDALRAMAGDGLDPEPLVFDPQLGLLVNRLEAGGWVARTVLAGDGPLITREPLAFADVLSKRGLEAGVPVRLSRHAVLHQDGDGLVLASGAARARAVVHDPRVAALLAAPGEDAGLEPDEREAVLRVLLQARLVIRADDEDEATQAVAQWNPVDLLFHARTRLGRRGGGYGGTYPYKDVFPEPPALHPETEGERTPLPAPDLEAAAAADPPLTTVLEQRRSIRVHDDAAPITARQLGELLYRAARVRTVVRPEGQGEFALRPYPSGGALYELEIYPVVRLCEGVEPGLHRYDPFEHALVRVADAGPATDGLLEHARVAALMEQRPQVLLTIAARFDRVSWKYEGMPYALILKHVGVLYQTLYLVATAMGLAPCALGGGDADLFARAAGLDYAAETSVGEFIVGSRPADESGPGLAEVAEPTPSF